LKEELNKTKYMLQKKSNELNRYVDTANKREMEIKDLKVKIDSQNETTTNIKNEKEKIMEQVYELREAKMEMTKQCIQYQEDILKKEEIIHLLNDNIEKMEITNQELMEYNEKYKAKENNVIVELNKQKEEMEKLIEDIKLKKKDIDK